MAEFDNKMNADLNYKMNTINDNIIIINDKLDKMDDNIVIINNKQDKIEGVILKMNDMMFDICNLLKINNKCKNKCEECKPNTNVSNNKKEINIDSEKKINIDNEKEINIDNQKEINIDNENEINIDSNNENDDNESYESDNSDETNQCNTHIDCEEYPLPGEVVKVTIKKKTNTPSSLSNYPEKDSNHYYVVDNNIQNKYRKYETLSKYIKTAVIPRYLTSIKECKFGNECWNIICICTHNKKQNDYYKKFFYDKPCPYLTTNSNDIRLCKQGNKCINKDRCKFAHSEQQLYKMKKNLDQWNQHRYEYWLHSIKNDIGDRFPNECFDNYKIVLTYDD
jgi:hypothetical protein